MSVRVMSEVWQNSPYKGGTLLVLLALADWADDSGRCFPKIPAIAKKARLSEREVTRVLGDMVEEGVVEVATESSRGRGKVYQIITDKLTGDKVSPEKSRTDGVTNDAAHIRKNRHIEPPSSAAASVKHMAEEIQRLYPRKDGKVKAIEKTVKAIEELAKRKEFKSLGPPEQVLIGVGRWLYLRVRRQVALYTSEGRELTKFPYLATWMFGKRYDDETLDGNAPAPRANVAAARDGLAVLREQGVVS
jgi:hypothetical protein